MNNLREAERIRELLAQRLDHGHPSRAEREAFGFIDGLIKRRRCDLKHAWEQLPDGSWICFGCDERVGKLSCQCEVSLEGLPGRHYEGCPVGAEFTRRDHSHYRRKVKKGSSK